MIPQFTKEDKKIVTDFISEFNKIFSVKKPESRYKVSDSSNYHYSEVYVWNKFTIQVRAIGDYSLTGFSVEIYFDSEMLDHKNKVQCFNKYESYDALQFAKKIYKQNTDNLLVCALSSSDC